MLNYACATQRRGRHTLTAIARICLLLPALCPAEDRGEPPPTLDQLTIIAPSAAGGGYDLTAQAMRRVLESTGIARNVKVTRSPGAGGLLGLAELIAAHRDDGGVLLIGGLVMIGATASNRAAISLLDATPIARLIGEPEVVAVPAASPHRTLDDLLDAMRAASQSVRWVGGSAGGADEQLMWQLARAADVDPHSMHYTALPGGSEIGALLLRDRHVAGISGLAELQSWIQEGRLRGLAVSSPERLPGVDLPTFGELGIAGLTLTNWRGVFAAPGLGQSDRRRLEVAIGSMARHPAWQAELARHHWTDAYLDGAAFRIFVADGQQAAESGSLAAGLADVRVLPIAIARRFMWAVTLALVASALGLALYVQGQRSCRREVELRRALQELSREVERKMTEVQGMRAGLSSHIEREFNRWGLTAAECAVAQLMLKGLRLEDIASMRHTSGRTVRQQAQAIYRKAGLDGRSDLSAYFLEEFLAPAELRAKSSA